MSATVHSLAKVDTANHPSGVELMNGRCDCGECSGWTRSPEEVWEHQAMHESREQGMSEAGIRLRFQPRGLRIHDEGMVR